MNFGIFGIDRDTAIRARKDAKSWLAKHAIDYLADEKNDKSVIFLIIQQYLFADSCVKNRKPRIDETEVKCSYGEMWFAYIDRLIGYCNHLSAVDVVDHMDFIESAGCYLTECSQSFLEAIGLFSEEG